MKQSSIEYLMDKLFDPSSMVKEQLEWFEQAKAMHKKEIMNAHGEEQSYLEDDGSWTRQTAEHYYNETFNTKDK